MHGEHDDDYRFVLDEESLVWRDAEPSELADLMDRLADLLAPVADGRQAALLGVAYDVQCRESTSFLDLLFTPNAAIPRDARVRLQQLIQKCRTIDEHELGEQDIPRQARFKDREWSEPSWGVSHALARAAAGRGMSCLVLPVREPRESEWTTVERQPAPVDIHVLAEPSAVAGFWRGLYARETVPEAAFFALAPRAFPELLFAPGLRFNAFDGDYGEILPWLVRLLGAVNDHFGKVLALCRGDQKQVVSRFSAMNLDISPESPKTKQSAKAWSQRSIGYGDATYRCEWHGKREWNKDRVHFSLPISVYEGRILIGIFTRHLDT